MNLACKIFKNNGQKENRKNRTKKYSTVSIGQSINSIHREDIDNLFNSMFDTHYDNDNEIHVYKPELAEYLKENFGKGAINKKLSPFENLKRYGPNLAK